LTITSISRFSQEKLQKFGTLKKNRETTTVEKKLRKFKTLKKIVKLKRLRKNYENSKH